MDLDCEVILQLRAPGSHGDQVSGNRVWTKHGRLEGKGQTRRIVNDIDAEADF